jgi:hypothetical protein
MKVNSLLSVFTILVSSFCFLCSCDDTESYADLLKDENKAVNNFLSDQKVISEIPSDSIFEYGVDAPYYKMDDDGNIYMQVIKPGTKDNMAKKDQLIYFRFTRYDLFAYSNGVLPEGWGNANDFDYKNTEFRFGNYSLPSSSQWGTAIQLPLYYLGIDCEVNLVIKSQYGYTDEISNVIPFLYNVRYFKSQI